MVKNFTRPTDAIDNKTNFHKKWVIQFFLFRRLSLLSIFLKFGPTIHQDKNCLAFFSRKNITESLHSEIVRNKCNLQIKFYFLSLIIFQNINAQLNMLTWGKAVILGTYRDICCILLYMLALMSVIYCQYKTIVNIDIIDLNAFIE